MITIGRFLVRLASMKISEKNLKFAGVNTVPPGSVILIKIFLTIPTS